MGDGSGGIWMGFAEFTHAQFWVSVLEIIWINVLLSGDNAIVIALACRGLPPKQRLGGMVLGTAVALVLRLLFASIVSMLMHLPYIKIIGGLALLWIAVKLLAPNGEDDLAGKGAPEDNLWQAVKLIAFADVVMSLDNVIAVAGAANGNYALLIFGLGISVPAIVAGAAIIMAIMRYVPLLVWAGAALLGWIAGDMIATDPIVVEHTDAIEPLNGEKFRLLTSAVGAASVVLGALFWSRARQLRLSNPRR